MWKKIINFHCKLILPQDSLNKLRTRKMRVFHILLIGSLYLVSIATAISIINYLLYTIIYHQPFMGSSPIILIGILFGLTNLFWLSKINHHPIAAYLFLFLLWLPTAYTSLRWGALIYQAVIIYALIIILAGILINSYASFIMTFLTGIFLITITTLQYNQQINVDYSWRQYPEDIYNAIMICITLGVIALVSWLYNHELEHAFHHMLKSEKDLKNERDSLDKQIKIRTQQLQTAQSEKMIQWQQFVELGRSAAEIFHDIKNPLTSASLNLEQLCKTERVKNSLSNKKIQDTLQSINYISQFVTATQNQLQLQQSKKWFNPTKPIYQAIQFLSPKASLNRIKVIAIVSTNMEIYGSPNKLYQAIINLISNAIDSYLNFQTKQRHEVFVELKQKHRQLKIMVKDNGCGISFKNQLCVFNPLYTTKSIDQGTGLGLNIAKSIVENDFNGSIFFCSQLNKGTAFMVSLPIE